MIELGRQDLYLLGFFSTFAFTLRFFIQWIQSEKAGKSLVTATFWQISLVGNVLLLIHSFIQVQFHVCVVQACNTVISWRNLNLMGKEEDRYSLITVIAMLGGAIGLSSLAFVIQGFFIADSDAEWFRTPVLPWGGNAGSSVSTLWHVVGTLGVVLFNSRFWVQWWESETARKSFLSPSFWVLSLIGGLLSVAYFIKIDDVVNFIGPAFGLIPYARNLMLYRNSQRHIRTESP